MSSTPYTSSDMDDLPESPTPMVRRYIVKKIILKSRGLIQDHDVLSDIQRFMKIEQAAARENLRQRRKMKKEEEKKKEEENKKETE